MTDSDLYQIKKEFIKEKIKESLRRSKISAFEAILGLLQGFNMSVNFIEEEIGHEKLYLKLNSLPAEAKETLSFCLELSEVVTESIKTKGKKFNGN